MQFLDQNRAAITKILDVETGRYAANELQNWPLERTRTALDGLNKAIETLGSDERVAGKYGLRAEDIRKIRPEAERLYHDQGYQAYANCYTYAMNDRDRYSYGGDSPGQRASPVPGAPNYPMISMNTGSTRDYEEYKRTLIKGVEADGAIIGGKDAEAIEGYYRVAVYALPPDKAPKGDNPWTVMHFARDNRDGGWSHKAGSKPVMDKDNDGRPIPDQHRPDGRTHPETEPVTDFTMSNVLNWQLGREMDYPYDAAYPDHRGQFDQKGCDVDGRRTDSVRPQLPP